MTKREYEKFLNENMRGLPLEKQEEVLRKIIDEWTPSILEKKLEKYTQCYKCGKYVLTSRLKKITKKCVRTKVIQPDAGYGDDDIIGEVEELDYYFVCPKCGNMQKYDSEYIRTISERRRR